MNQQKPKPAEENMHTSPYANEEPSGTMLNYGLLILSGTLIALGIPFLFYTLITPTQVAIPNQVFFWIGLGLSLGGGGLLSLAFAESSRLPRGTRMNPGALVGGIFMSLIGLMILAVRFNTNEDYWLNQNDVLIWIGIGLFIGGGGICAAGWIPKDRTAHEKSVDRSS